MTSRFREIPSVNQVLQQKEVSDLLSEYSHESIVEMIREELATARLNVSAGGEPPQVETVAESVSDRAASQWKSWPETVINATGVILHTNLGRAPLSDESIEAASVAASGYSDLEFDLESGRRGSRQAHISRLVCQATGAEAALVVNNNASAVMLGLAAIAAGKEVIVSRGEAVEIGGGFRIPDVLRQSGATLVEVGTTNRTYARDFEAAINENTGAILSVHASNFRVMGFTHAPTTAELVEVGDRNNVPVLHDLGSGCLLDTRPYGLAYEPRPQESVARRCRARLLLGRQAARRPAGRHHRGQARVRGRRCVAPTGSRRQDRQDEHGRPLCHHAPLHTRRTHGEDTHLAHDFRVSRRVESAGVGLERERWRLR